MSICTCPHLYRRAHLGPQPLRRMSAFIRSRRGRPRRISPREPRRSTSSVTPRRPFRDSLRCSPPSAYHCSRAFDRDAEKISRRAWRRRRDRAVDASAVSTRRFDHGKAADVVSSQVPTRWTCRSAARAASSSLLRQPRTTRPCTGTATSCGA